jgi:hypothetical protein
MINQTELSPFTAQRYELDGNHVYFLPASVFAKLEEPKPTLLVGTRGTGKTTLLKALSWDERLNNPHFKQQLKASAFDKNYIGLYFKLPNLQLALLDRWLRDEDDFDYAAVFAFYLDLCWLEAVIPALDHLQAARVIALTPECESDFFDAFEALFEGSNIDHGSLSANGRSIKTALTSMHSMRNALERFARRRSDLNDVLDALPIGQIGSFGRAVGAALMTAIDTSEKGAVSPWSLRICMDEGEALSLRQQRVINSMIRLAEWPVFYIVAYVSRPLDVTSTFLPNQTLQIADRQIHILDEISDKEFRILAEGVINTRLRAAGKSAKFRARGLLGSLSIDTLLGRILRDSEDVFARELLERAEAATPSSDPPPIYETYLRLRRPELSSDLTGRAKRKQSSASLRKQMVAAYLNICSELGSKPLYASSDMVLQISDKCMRDFLRQMDTIYQGSGRPIDAFLRSEVPVLEQNNGIREAAHAKLRLFTERVFSVSAQANQLVDLLAQATAEVQTTGRNFEQIRTPERGIFTYQTGNRLDPSANESLIRDAAEAGFLKILPEGQSEELKFRVHASLAPHYGFSYRGAYYDMCTLSDREIDVMKSVSNDQDARRVVRQLVDRATGRRSSGSETQLSLADLDAEST